MGNTVTKEQETARRARGMSASSSSGFGAAVLLPFAVQPGALGKKLKKDKERQKLREEHAWNLVVRYEECVDGGYLAPYGTYKSNLDYRTEIVRSLIVERKLAPFYTPLQDFDEDWSDDKLLMVLDQLPLHLDQTQSPEDAELEEEEDMDSHKIRRSSHSLRKLESRKCKEKVRLKLVKWQEELQWRYVRDKRTVPVAKRPPMLPSRDLQLKLYRDSQECPICFLYYPPYLNISRCCIQPICSECFVQIKRLDPHPPHDEQGNETDTADPQLLISESAKCPFCAMPDFGVTYYPPTLFRTGLDGAFPGAYKNKDTTTIEEEANSGQFALSPTSIGDAINKSRSAMGTPPRHSSSFTHVGSASGSASGSSLSSATGSGTGSGIVNGNVSNVNSNVNSTHSTHNTTNNTPEPETGRTRRKRQGSIPANSAGVITTDMIRPDWDTRLKNARVKLARRSALASAIHASSLIYDHNDASEVTMLSHQEQSSGTVRSRSETLELEERMIEEALRLSLLEEDRRK